MWKEYIKTIFVLVVGLVGAVGAVSVAPLYFESLGASADINAESQQQYWEDLMKYKLWGTTGLTFNKEKVHIADVNGYNGTATGDISFFNGQHHVGGPLLAGGNLRLADNGTSPKNDTLAGGPVRVLGKVSIADYAAQQSDASISGSSYDGPICAMGGFTTKSSQTWDYTLRVWASTVTDGIYGHKVVAGTEDDYDSTAVVDDVTSYYKYEPYTVSIGNQPYTIAVGNYKQCPEDVPQVDSHLVVPIWPEPAEWSAGISLNQGYTEKAYIHVPPDSVYNNEYGTYDLYIENIYMSNSPNKYVYVVMPPGGRLTRIFVRDGINIQPSANSAVIQVVYVDENATFDRATNQWDTSVLVDSNLVSNKKYAGNLMFYTNKDINWSSMISPSYQGTFMTTGTFTIKDHFTLAGQLVANNLVFESDITGDFRYVPFDPPILNIDPELLENGAFPENGFDAEIPISLDERTNTSVDFNFCFDLEDAVSTAVREDFNSTAKAPFPICVVHDTTWNFTYDEDGVTKLDSSVANVDVVRDSGYVKIAAGRLTPTDDRKAYLNVMPDGLIEGEEFLKMNIFNLAGAVLPGNRREGSFTLKVIDATNPPIVTASSVTGVEDETYAFSLAGFNIQMKENQVLRGIFVSSVPSKGTLTYKGDAVTDRIFIPKDSVGDLRYRGVENGFGSPYVTFMFQAQDEDLATSGTASMTINLEAVNDAPSALASDFSVNEKSAVGTKATGSLVVTDVDDTQFAYSLVGGDTDKFSIDASTGDILVKDATLDFETKSCYSVVVRVRDMSATMSLADTLSYELTVNILLNDVNEAPTLANDVASVDENAAKGTAVKTVVGTDEDSFDAGKLTYSITGGNTGNVFVIDPVTGLVSVNGPIDYETNPVYTLKITVADAAGLTATANLVVNVVDKPEAPVFVDDTPTFSVKENSVAGTPVETVTASDVDGGESLTYSIVDATGTFVVDPASGLISVKASNTIDYETKADYSVLVIVTDKDGLKDTATVAIGVIDVNENPTVAKQNFDFDEHKPAGEVVGTVVAGDLDTAAAFTQNKFTAVGGDTAIFAISEAGVITTKREVDYESEPKTYKLVVAVTDKADPTLMAIDTMSIAVNNVNEIPHITSTEFSVPENSDNSTKIGTIVSSDPDGETAFTYELLEVSEFVTVTPSGDILVKDRSKFDFETVESFKIKVKVTDSGNASSDTTITVRITDVNEEPEIKDQTLTTKEDAKVGSEVGTVVATDLDTKSSEFSHLTYTLVGESDKFTVKEDGTVILKDTLDYEKDSVYVIKVEVNDGEFADTAKITVKVINVIEKSEVEITRAETSDSVWLVPDTLFINTTDLCVEWKEDGKLKGPDCDLDLEEGKNLVIKTFKDPSKDVPGVDTLVVLVSTAAPVVTVTKVSDEESATNIFTIVEQQSKSDSSFYVNEKKNDIRVTVTDPVTDTKESFTVKVDLDTVSIPSKTFKNTLAGLVDANLTLNEKPASGVTHTPVNGDVIAVSYKETVDGKDLVMTYYTDKDGNVIENEDGVKLLNVAYVSEIGGKEVKITYNVDAFTGEVVKTSGGYAKNSDSGVSSSSGKDDGKSSSSKGDGKSSSSKGGSGDSGDSDEFVNEVVYTITYDYVDKAGNMVTVSYGVDADGEIVRDANGSLGYQVGYTYVNKYGNSATQSLFIVLDETPPVVEILYPAGGDILYDNFVEVKWTVNGVVQDTLVTQGLKKGSNSIIRFYRDKAGNVDSALVVVIMKNAKDVDISVEQPVTKSDVDKVAEYYSVNEPEEGENYAVSIYNNKTKKEVETLVGGSFDEKEGSGDAPYPGLEGHLGPTLGIETKVPTVNSMGGLATLDDLLGKDGMVALEGVDAANSEKATVEEYLEEYCTDEFAENALKDLGRANLYKTKMYVKVWIYTSLGQFVDYYSFVQDLDDPDYVNDAGILTLFFELKPDKDGNVRSETGRLYATGAYVYKTEVELKSTLQCTLPPLSESSKNESSQKGAVRTVKEDLLKSFGYRRPTVK